MTFIDYLNNLKYKNKSEVSQDSGLNVALYYTLCKDKLYSYIVNLYEYIWYMEPQNFYILMYFTIRKKY